MSRANISVVVHGTELGEGPHWVERKQELVYVDIPGRAVRRYVPSTSSDYCVPIAEGRPTAIVPIENQADKYLVTVERQVCVLEWDGVSSTSYSLKPFHEVEPEYPKNRFNDGKCDNQGRYWGGTMGYETTPGNVDPEKGNLYKLDAEGKMTSHVDKIGISNGLCWSSDSTKFYFIDSVAYSVDVFDFNATNGTVANRRVLFDLKKHGIAGLPDGMTIDANNNLWVAVYLGGKILHLDSITGKLIDTVHMDELATKTTSVAFGGPNLDTLYVTSARFGLTNEELAVQKNPGAVFAITNLGVKGISGGVPYKGNVTI